MELNIELANSNSRTVISDSYFTSPFKIAKPFYNKVSTEIMIMTATAGIMKGDNYKIKIKSKESTNSVITNQSYSKIFNTGDGSASQKLTIEVDSNAAIAWIPKPTIPFKDSTYVSESVISLKKDSRLFYCDILAGGRVGMGEMLEMNKYHSRTLVLLENKPIFLDNSLFEKGGADYRGLGYLEDYSHQGTVYMYGYRKPILPECIEKMTASISDAPNGVCVRMAGASGDLLYSYVRYLYHLVSGENNE